MYDKTGRPVFAGDRVKTRRDGVGTITAIHSGAWAIEVKLDIPAQELLYDKEIKDPYTKRYQVASLTKI